VQIRQIVLEGEANIQRRWRKEGGDEMRWDETIEWQTQSHDSQ
jgi:hypothetical protein